MAEIRILLVGNGGREHALAWSLSKSPKVANVLCVPGNGGTASEPKVKNVTSVAPDDFAGLLKLAVDNDINLLIPGPEAPLVAGITDYFEKHGPARIKCFGPSEAAARMEGSKAFSKDFMKRCGIPTAAYETFTAFEEAKAYLESHREMRMVIKADGLAAGKGVIIPTSHEEAVAGLKSIMLDREFGDAGDHVIVEEFLEGEELSILSLCDGYTIRSLPPAQDHKRAKDNDEGKNTGGMGCYAPTQLATPELVERMHREILQPTIDNMRREGYPMVGCLFTGFMITPDGPKCLEYNVRFGDPECQTLLPLLDNDLADLMIRCTTGTLDGIDLKIKPDFSTTVVVAAGGYPDVYSKGIEMTIQEPPENTFLFYAGTTINTEGQLRTSGGRVIACTAIGSSIPSAVEKAYTGVRQCISFDRMHYRTDIARRELNRKAPAQPQPVATSSSVTTPKKAAAPLTYASSGVSITAGNDLVSRISPLVASTARPGSAAQIGGFGGLFSLPLASYPSTSPTLVCAIDGIGTKLLLAHALNVHNTVGIDLVAMNVNDLVVQGAEPLAFLDYYACGRLEVESAASFVEGVVSGCKEAGCALVGGETAEMPALYQGGTYDAAGCAVGALAAGRRALPLLEEMVVGDVLVGLASNGCHSNGFSLVRRIVEESGLRYDEPAPWDGQQTLGEALLTPTRIYVKSLLPVLYGPDGKERIKGMAHITGGGILENVPRTLPKGLAARVEAGAWQMPGVFKWLKQQGRIEARELARTFNCGLGMMCVVEEGEVEAVVKGLEEQGETIYRVGRLVERGDGEACVIEGIERW